MKEPKDIFDCIEYLKSTSQFIIDTRAALCASQGLNYIQGLVFLDIGHNPSSKITDICKRLNKKTSTISPLIHKLIDKNLIEKSHGDDNRVYEVNLTEKGIAVMESINNELGDFAIPRFEKLTDKEFYELLQALKKFNKVCVY